jgi:hypothetical protein
LLRLAPHVSLAPQGRGQAHHRVGHQKRKEKGLRSGCLPYVHPQELVLGPLGIPDRSPCVRHTALFREPRGKVQPRGKVHQVVTPPTPTLRPRSTRRWHAQRHRTPRRETPTPLRWACVCVCAARRCSTPSNGAAVHMRRGATAHVKAFPRLRSTSAWLAGCHACRSTTPFRPTAVFPDGM